MTYVPNVPVYDPYEYDPYDLIPTPPPETSVVTPPQLEEVRNDLEKQIKQIYNDINDLSYYDTYITNLVNENSPTYTLFPDVPSNRLYLDNKADPTTEGVIDVSQDPRGHQYYLHQNGDFVDITDPNGDGTESVHLIEPGVTKILLANHKTTTAAINASGGTITKYLNEKGEWHRGLTHRAKSGGTGGNNDYVKLASDENTSFVINKTDGLTYNFLNAKGGSTRGLTWANATVGSGANPSQHPIVLRNNTNLSFKNFNDVTKTTTYLRADGSWGTPPGTNAHSHSRYLINRASTGYDTGWQYTAGALGIVRLDVEGNGTAVRGNATFTGHDGTCPGLYLEPTPGTKAVYYNTASSATKTASRSSVTAVLCDHAAANVRIGLPYKTAQAKRSAPETKSVSEIDLHKIKTIGHELDVLSLQEAGFDLDISEYDINGGDSKQEKPAEYEDEVTYGVGDVVAFLVHTVQRQHEQLTTLEAEVTKLRNA